MAIRLAAFARATKARVTVVFDGAPDKVAPEGSVFHGVRVLYAERGSDADTRIVAAFGGNFGFVAVTVDGTARVED